MRTAVCLYVRNEERDIAEWVVYHSLIGFDAFMIYDNGSDDGTPEVLDRLRRIYNIKLISWPRATKFSQLEAYDDCLKNFRDDFEWIAFVDSDEFIVPARDGSIDAFLTHYPAASAVALNWAIFGSSGHVAMPKGLITEEFCFRGRDDTSVNLHTKMIVRPKAALRVYDPHYIGVEGDKIVKADGTPFSRKTIGRSDDTSGFDVCRVNHYFVRSQAHWAAKMARGYREGHRSSEFFALYDLNEVKDRWAAERSATIRSVLDAIGEMPLRTPPDLSHVAVSDEQKLTKEWIDIPSFLDDVMYRAPSYATEPENTLFDAQYYLQTYPDIRESGIDPFTHFVHCGYNEGRRPCRREDILRHVVSNYRPAP